MIISTISFSSNTAFIAAGTEYLANIQSGINLLQQRNLLKKLPQANQITITFSYKKLKRIVKVLNLFLYR
jgi:hypothetical protein